MEEVISAILCIGKCTRNPLPAGFIPILSPYVQHHILYDDGDKEDLDLRAEDWVLEQVVQPVVVCPQLPAEALTPVARAERGGSGNTPYSKGPPGQGGGPMDVPAGVRAASLPPKVIGITRTPAISYPAKRRPIAPATGVGGPRAPTDSLLTGSNPLLTGSNPYGRGGNRTHLSLSTTPTCLLYTSDAADE